MTGHQINSLVGDLVAMAQAMDELPKVQHELSVAKNDISVGLDRIMYLEDSILKYKAEIKVLHASLREAEVAKDSAETMFLEADERTSRALDFIKSSFGAAGSLIQSLEPVKAQPDPIHEHEQRLYQEATDYNTDINDRTHANNELATLQGVDADTVQGQSEPDPTSAVTSDSVISQNDVSETANHMADVSPPSYYGPYHNKRYIYTPGWISRQDWINGGGTEADYDWRESSINSI